MEAFYQSTQSWYLFYTPDNKMMYYQYSQRGTFDVDWFQWFTSRGIVKLDEVGL